VLGGALFALVMLWTFTATPRYRSTALLQLTVDEGSGGLASALSGIPGAPLLGLSKDRLETEMGVLRSRRLIDAVIDSLALTVRRVSPVAGRDLVAAVWLTEGAEVEGELSFTRTEQGSYAVEARDLVPTLAVPGTLALGDTLAVGGARVRLAAALRDSAVERFTLELRPRYEARKALLDQLEVLRPSAGAQLVSLTFDDPDAHVAARGLQVLIGEYLRYTARTERGDARYTVEELRRQLDAQSTALAQAERDLRAFQERTGIVVPDEQAAAQVKRYATLRGQLDLLTVERDALAQMLALVQGRASGASASSAYRQLATFPTLISNRAIQDLLVALTELENDRSALLLLRSEQNADVRQLTARIVEIETQLERLGAQSATAVAPTCPPRHRAAAGLRWSAADRHWRISAAPAPASPGYSGCRRHGTARTGPGP
jgi:uncharacterized protein involved in exopolysaccharide biosynthesis